MEIIDANSGKLLLIDSIPLNQRDVLSQLSLELNVSSSVLFLLSSTGVVLPAEVLMIPPARYFLLKKSGFSLQLPIPEVSKTHLRPSDSLTGDIFEEALNLETNSELVAWCSRLPEVDKELFQSQESGIQLYLDYVDTVTPVKEMMDILLNWKDVGTAVLLRTEKYLDDCDKEFKEIESESAFLPPRETAEKCIRDLLQLSLENNSSSSSSRLLSWLSSTRLGESYILSLSKLTMKLSSIRHSLDVLKSDHLESVSDALENAWRTSERRFSEINSALSWENYLETGMRNIVETYTTFRDQLVDLENLDQELEQNEQLAQPSQVLQAAHPVQPVQVLQVVKHAQVVQDEQLVQPVHFMQVELPVQHDLQPVEIPEIRENDQVFEDLNPVKPDLEAIQRLEKLISHFTGNIESIQKELKKEASLVLEAKKAAILMKDEERRIYRFVNEAAESAALITAKLSVQFSQKIQKFRKSIEKLKKISKFLEIPGHIIEISREIDSELDRRKAATARMNTLQITLIQSLETENAQRSAFVEKMGKVLPAKLIPELLEPALSKLPMDCSYSNIGIQSDPAQTLSAMLQTTVSPDFETLEIASFRKIADLKTECNRLNTELRTLTKALKLEQVHSQRLEAALTNLNVESRILLSPGLSENRKELENQIQKLIEREEICMEMMRRQNAQMGRD